jgi:hypothetical protein
MAQVTDDFAMLVAFDEDGKIKWAQYPDGSKYSGPVASFDTEPLIDITLHRVEAFDVLVWDEKDAAGKPTRRMCTHWQCQRYW